MQFDNYIYMITTVKHDPFYSASLLPSPSCTNKLLIFYLILQFQPPFQNFENGVPGATTVRRVLINFSHGCHKSEVGIEPTTSEVTRPCSEDCDHYDISVQGHTILHEKFKFPAVDLCFIDIVVV